MQIGLESENISGLTSYKLNGLKSQHLNGLKSSNLTDYKYHILDGLTEWLNILDATRHDWRPFM